MIELPTDTGNGTVSPGPLIKVQVGPRNAHSEGDVRFYRWKGNEYPSVTTVRRLAGMPFNLHQWALSQVVNRAIDGYAELGRILSRADDDAVKGAKTWLRNAAIEERDKAAARGTAVHDAAATGKSLAQVSADVAPYLRQYLHWLAVSRAEILMVEKQIFNLDVGYAGTFDLLCRFPNGAIWLIDIKTGKGTYPEHALQCCAYAMADFIGEDDEVDRVASELLRQATGLAVLHLGVDGWTFDEVLVTPELWQAFRALLVFGAWVHDNPKIDTLTRGHREGQAA